MREALHGNVPHGCSLPGLPFARRLVTCGVEDIPWVSLMSVLGLGVDRLLQRPLPEREV